MTFNASTELIASGGNIPPVSDLERHSSQLLLVVLRFLPRPPPGKAARKAKGPHPPASVSYTHLTLPTIYSV